MSLVNFSLDDVGVVFTSIREAITGKKIVDPVELAKLDIHLSDLEHAIKTGQIAVNEKEASHPSLFVSGWRPFVGWVSGAGIAYSFMLKPLLDWSLNMVIAFSGESFTPEQIAAMQPVSLDTGTLIALVTSMLGLGVIRMSEKKNGVARVK